MKEQVIEKEELTVFEMAKVLVVVGAAITIPSILFGLGIQYLLGLMAVAIPLWAASIWGLVATGVVIVLFGLHKPAGQRYQVVEDDEALED